MIGQRLDRAGHILYSQRTVDAYCFTVVDQKAVASTVPIE